PPLRSPPPRPAAAPAWIHPDCRDAPAPHRPRRRRPPRRNCVRASPSFACRRGRRCRGAARSAGRGLLLSGRSPSRPPRIAIRSTTHYRNRITSPLKAVSRNMTISPHDLAEMRQSIEALNAEFAWLIDHKDGAGVADLFTAGGVYDMSNRLYRGRAEIAG